MTDMSRKQPSQYPEESQQVMPGALTTLEPVACPDDEDSSEEFELPSNSSTPNLSEAMENIKRSMSFTTFQQLSSKPPGEVRRQIQKKLWRPHDDETKIPNDWERLMVHVIRAASRAFTLAYGIRSSLEFLFVFIKVLRSRKPIKKSDLKAAFVGERTVRFALTFGAWAAIYKFTNNALRLLTPPTRSARTLGARRSRSVPEGSMKVDDNGELTLMTKEKSNVQKKKAVWKHISAYDPRARKWHAYLAGAVSSLALLIESREFTRSFGLQVFVRGMEGVCQLASRAGYINIPYASILIFGLANVQIMIAWLGSPHLLERSYKNWIDKASSVPKPALELYRQSVNGGMSPWDMVALFGGVVPEPVSTNPVKFADLPPNKYALYGVSGDVLAKVHRWIEHGNPPRYATCAIQHPQTTNHLFASVRNFVATWKFVMPVYLTLYVVPTVFLRPKALRKAPTETIMRSLLGASRSSSFLAVYVFIVKSMFCLVHVLADGISYSRLNDIPFMRRVSELLIDNRMKGLGGFLSCLSLFIEDRRRRKELTLYVLPKALESFWATGRIVGYIPHVPLGEYIMAATGLSMLMGSYAQNPDNLSKLVSLIIYQFIGRN